MIYKITYDLVAIPALDYLTCNQFHSGYIHLIADRVILTLKDYYKYTFLHRLTIYPSAVQPRCLPGNPHLTLNPSSCFYLSTILTPPPLFPPPPTPHTLFFFYSFHKPYTSFIPLIRSNSWYTGTPSGPLMKLRCIGS